MLQIRHWFLSFLLLSTSVGMLLACSSSEDRERPAPVVAPNYEVQGAYPVGHAMFTLEDTVRGRSLPVQIWYPATTASRTIVDKGTPLEELQPEGGERETLKELIREAPERCTTRRTRSAPDVEPASGTFPVVLFSHCWGCLRFSATTIAERLASHGIAVVAPDHVGGTLFDQLAGNIAPVGDEFLLIREGDIQVTLDTILDPSSEVVPGDLRGRFDGARVGVMGHSFGSVTAGKVLQDDHRFKAGFAMAAPWSILGVKMAEIQAPIFFLLAQEDHSIGAIGNKLIRKDYEAANKAWLAEVQDAGHWSFSDICALVSSFKPGCGEGKRQEDGSEFDYIDIDTGRGIAASYATAFFASTLLGEATATTYLESGHPSSSVQISKK